MRIRTASPEDVPLTQAIEAASGAIFREVGMDDIAGAVPLSTRVLSEYQRTGRAWTATDDDEPVAFAVADLIDGCAHVAQISVRPTTLARASAAGCSTTSAGGRPRAGCPG